MPEDKVLFSIRVIPHVALTVVKAAKNGRWTAFFTAFTDEATDGAYYYDLVWWLQFKTWWPPVFFYHGWLKRG